MDPQGHGHRECHDEEREEQREKPDARSVHGRRQLTLPGTASVKGSICASNESPLDNRIV